MRISGEEELRDGYTSFLGHVRGHFALRVMCGLVIYSIVYSYCRYRI